MPLDLLIPDLLPEPGMPASMRELRLPWVEKWLARADVQRVEVQGAQSWLARAFEVREPAPVAAITLAADDSAREGSWLRADPVHLRVGQDSVTLFDTSMLAVTREESQALVEVLKALFAEDGLIFYAPHPERWYVRVPTGELPQTVPMDQAIGRSVFRLLPKGEGRINWGSAITETQMVMSNHPVNVAREAQGQPAINSVWFWGGGTLPPKPKSAYALVYANDALARGLGTLSGVRVVDRPDDLSKVDAVRAAESVLVVEERLTRAARSGEAEAWVQAAKQLDEAWFAHLGEIAERFEGVRLVLPTARDAVVATIAPSAKWRWMRKRKALATYA